MALFFIICAQKEAIRRIDYNAADGMARSEAGWEKQGFSSLTTGRKGIADSQNSKKNRPGSPNTPPGRQDNSAGPAWGNMIASASSSDAPRLASAQVS
ncbi:hypothetical protein RC54_04095 [Herbaspirillum rubrisubalbicans]|uniref:Uncharacterized protein n=1 Tax=Herbaspirillum rubrisubalbicans TaxID=80842 RepID=A0AAD0XG22_9BURK|nr:hypothetical protein RC54_04095 [Herbaspirillum rubrisubalbicans]